MCLLVRLLAANATARPKPPALALGRRRRQHERLAILDGVDRTPHIDVLAQ
jgi:hypothetical protein